MKTVFTIGSEEAKTDTLLIEIGEDYCCYAFLNRQKKLFELIRYISFDRFESVEKLSNIFDGLRHKEFESVFISAAYVQALMIPQYHDHEGQAWTGLIFDNASDKQLKDTVTEWQMVIAYSVPAAIYEQIISAFSPVHFVHAYTPTLKIYNGFVAPDQIDVYFTTQFFRVIVKKDQQLLLAQTYSYKTPLDVVYYLLKICYEFQLEQSEVFLVLSGLIDQDSALYVELHNYFLNLHFAQSPAYTLPENEHPHYYFTSLYNLAACVS